MFSRCTITPGVDDPRYLDLEERIQQIPGVRAAGFTCTDKPEYSAR